MQIKRPVMQFVGPWPLLSIKTIKYHHADTHTHTHRAHIALYAFCTLLFLLTHFLSAIRNGVMVPIHKWRPVRPPRSPVAFLAIKRTSGRFLLGEAESPLSSCHQDWDWEATAAPSKTKWRKKIGHQNN